MQEHHISHAFNMSRGTCEFLEVVLLRFLTAVQGGVQYKRGKQSSKAKGKVNSESDDAGYPDNSSVNEVFCLDLASWGIATSF
jgi:hypothetical protein